MGPVRASGRAFVVCGREARAGTMRESDGGVTLFFRQAQEALESRRRVLVGGGAAGAAEHRELAEIDAALQRISRGSWGHCERCGGAIGRSRLRAMPEVRHCLTCSGTIAD
jgi:hypothetical protein